MNCVAGLVGLKGGLVCDKRAGLPKGASSKQIPKAEQVAGGRQKRCVLQGRRQGGGRIAAASGIISAAKARGSLVTS